MSRRVLLVLLAVYIALLAASQVVRYARHPEAPADLPFTVLESDPGGGGGSVRIAFRDYAPVLAPSTGVHANADPRAAGTRPPVVVIHGSPGAGAELDTFARAIAASGRRVLVPDLPGSGESTKSVGTYSYVAQADRLEAWLRRLAVSRVHLIGFSMGGGVAITMASAARSGPPVAAEVSSLTLLSSIGVQRMELLGGFAVNHIVHGLQLCLLVGARELVPHFGAFDYAAVGVPYARTFFDSDQRPLEGDLTSLQVPVLIVHGAGDPLVPVAAAREHARLVPQAELHVLDTDHFLVFREPRRAAQIVIEFLDRVEAGHGVTRSLASDSRRRVAALPFDPRAVPPVGPVGRAVLVVALALSTLVSEDVACITAGLLAAKEEISWMDALLGCALGIAIGDLAIFLAARFLGPAIVTRWPVSRMVSAPALDRSAAWLRRRGTRIVFASRFVPGTRVATAVAAGTLGMPIGAYTRALVVGTACWTPVIVGASMTAAHWAAMLLPRYGVLVGAAVAVLPIASRTPRGALFARMRRRLVGWSMRIRYWEFWPAWVVYAPIVLHVLRLAVRFRSLTVFTAANPGMPAAGFVGESKSDTLHALIRGGAPVAPFVMLEPFDVHGTAQARDFAAIHGYPLVIKPDEGQRGAGVRILRGADALGAAVHALRVPSLVQAYVPGEEFGLFYVREPGQARGRITSLTIKRFPSVRGDGVRSLKQLILDDTRAVARASRYFASNSDRLSDVPPAGERIQICALGSHCRGADFLDGRSLVTPALEAAAEQAARACPGFAYGRFDVRAPDVTSLQAGAFTILELNGVTSEPTHIYDPRTTFWQGVRTLSQHWTFAFQIGAAHRRAGARTWSLSELALLTLAHVRFARRATSATLAVKRELADETR